ncbi:Drug resistance protein [Stagonosporopsis vannaccii]|nr:Drug resistance protein [Stagonosporopsis vannaccii]
MLNTQILNKEVIPSTNEREIHYSSSTKLPLHTLQFDVESHSSSQKASTKENPTTLSDNERTTQPKEVPECPMSRTQLIAFVSITCISQLLSLSAMNQTVAPVILLARYFHVPNPGELSWFSAAYSMSVGTFILPAGRLGDMFGHKKMYLIGWLWFAVCSCITGFAYRWDDIVFSTLRALQGIGPALLIPNAVALIGRTLPAGQMRMLGFACFGACGPLGAALGAVFSALIAERWWWPCNFWVLSFIALLVMVCAWFILPADYTQESEPESKQPNFDYWGTITGVTGLILVNFALNQAPLVLWTTPYIGVLLAAGVILLVVFVVVELNNPDALVPIRGLSRDAVFALTCIVAGWASHGIWAYNLYLFLEHLRGQTALLTSAQTSPVAITGILFAFSTVWLIRHLGVAYVMLLSMTFFTIGALLLATMPLHQSYWAQTFVSVLLMPGAMNLSYPAANMLMSSALPKEKQGVAASLVSTLVNYSISAGLGFAGSVDRYTTDKALGRLDAAKVRHNIWDSEAGTVHIRLKGLRASFWFAVGLGCLGMVVAGVFVLVEERRKRAGSRRV